MDTLNTTIFLVEDDAVGHFLIDPFDPAAVAEHQAEVADVVESAGYATRILRDQLDGFGREGRFAATGDTHAVVDISSDFAAFQRAQQTSRRKAVVELGQIADALAELGLADQQQGDQEGVVELEVEQQADFLEERVVCQQLAFVDNDQRGLAQRKIVVEASVEPMDDFGVAGIEVGFADLVENFAQQFGRGWAGAGQQRDLGFFGLELGDEGTREHGFAAASLTGEQNSPLIAAQRVEQLGKGLGNGG